mmetsp:Transcript_9993/g.20921  ORF Transcript_9993/g.20921 Transcript_9993/m.20921 type:complete len:251 (+) Transcript_9993:236-988(+)
MKSNYEICLVGKSVILVPYRPEHVSRYHEWMKEPALLEATGSEPLSYDEEVEMQHSWLDDETKCTFIVHSAEACNYSLNELDKLGETESSSENAFRVEDNLDAMIGDVNLFLSEMDDEDESDHNETTEINESETADAAPGTGRLEENLQAEIDIMIANKECQGKGLGRAATCTMLLYGVRKLGIHRFFCKINEDNVNSIRLFKNIGFEQCNYAACFKQVELELKKTLPEIEQICKGQGVFYSTVPCSIEH